MKYRIVFTQRAVKDTSGLELKVKGRIEYALARYSEDPLNYARKMVAKNTKMLREVEY